MASSTPLLPERPEQPDDREQEPEDLEPESKRERYENDDKEEMLFLQHQGVFEEVQEAYVMNIDLEFTSNRQRKQFMRDPHIFLAKKMAGAEVQFKKLNENDKKLFKNAKDSEVSSFLRTEAVRRCFKL